MFETAVQDLAGDPAEVTMRERLAQSDALIGAVGPIMRHLLANDDHSIFSDEIVARVRGLIEHIAVQLLDELAIAAAGDDARVPHSRAVLGPIVDTLRASQALLGHAHALAIEWQLSERLHGRLALDPVLSPLLQALIASADPAAASSAISLMAAQARFGQSQRRMQLPLRELPGDLLHAALVALRNHAAGSGASEDDAARAESRIRAQYDESRSRLGLIARTVTAMGSGATAALSITHAGVGIFVSALAFASGQDRDLAILATNEGQPVRLALAARASGLKTAAIAELFLAIHPDMAVPEGLDRLGADRAALLLSQSAVAG